MEWYKDGEIRFAISPYKTKMWFELRSNGFHIPHLVLFQFALNKGGIYIKIFKKWQYMKYT